MALTSSARLDSWADHLGSTVAGLQRQSDAEKRAVDRRFQQLERQLQAVTGRLDGGEYLRDSGCAREKWAELQGSVTGLMEEVQALARRADGVDDRVWARASGAEELARQGARELQLQVQSLERHCRLQDASMEDAQRRQQSRQRRMEKLLEDFEWRLNRVEEEKRPRQVEEEVPCALDEQVQGVWEELESLGARMAAVEALHAKPSSRAGTAPARQVESRVEGTEPLDVRSAVGQLEGRLSTFDAKASAQLEEMRSSLATVRLKVEGQCQRQSAIAERLELVHVPTLEALRSEVASERARDLRCIEDRINVLTQSVERALEASDSSCFAEQADLLTHRVSSLEALTGTLRSEALELRSSLRAEMRNLLGGRGAKGGRTNDGSGAFAAAGRHLAADAGGAPSLSEPVVKEQLGALAEQVEALEGLGERVKLLDGRVVMLERREDARASLTGTSASGALSAILGHDDTAAADARGHKAHGKTLAGASPAPRAFPDLGAAAERAGPRLDSQAANTPSALRSAEGAGPRLDPQAASAPSAFRTPPPLHSQEWAPSFAPKERTFEAPTHLEDQHAHESCGGSRRFASELGLGRNAGGLEPAASRGTSGLGAPASPADTGSRTWLLVREGEDLAAKAQEVSSSPPPSPKRRPPAFPESTAAAKPRERRVVEQWPPQTVADASAEAPTSLARCPSHDSQRSSIDVAISPDESVEDASVLQRKCDVTEDVIPPTDASPSSAHAGFHHIMARGASVVSSPHGREVPLTSTSSLVASESGNLGGHLGQPLSERRAASGSEGSWYEPGDDGMSLNESLKESVDDLMSESEH